MEVGDVMWRLPETTDWATQQNKHEPTRSYGEEVFEVVSELKPKACLEIGCAWGVSTLATLMGSPECSLISVDSDPTNKAISEVEANGLDDRWIFGNMKSEEFWKVNRKTFDFVYVDGSHLYKDAKIDMFEGWKVLEPGGTLMMDDFTHPHNKKADCKSGEAEYGVSLAAWELFKEKSEEIDEVSCTTRLLMFRKKNKDV